MIQYRKAIFSVILSPLVVMTAVPAMAYDYPTTIDLATNTPDLTILGAYPFGFAGSSIAVGNFNGDGFWDIAIVACNASPLGGTRKGEITILWGPLDALASTVDLANAPNISRVFGPLDGDPVYCHAVASDLTGDGFDDLIWGQPGSPGTWAGRVYVIPGAASFPSTTDLANPPPGIVTVQGSSVMGFLGDGLCACDFDGDGGKELIVAATGLEYSEVYVISGNPTFQEVYSTAFNEPGMTRIIDTDQHRAVGRSIACADLDDDGFKDLVFGAPGNGTATQDGVVIFVYGDENLPDTLTLSDVSLRTKFLMPAYSHGSLGQEVAIGDIDKDGADDVVASAPQGDPLGCEDCGEVYVIHDANAIGDSLSLAAPNHPVKKLRGAGYATQHGIKLRIGDFDGDNYDDLLIANETTEANQRARTTLVHGSQLDTEIVSLPTDPNLTRIIEKVQGTRLGLGMAIGDGGADGWDDAVIGAKFASPLNRSYAGEVYVFFGEGIATSIESNGPSFLFSQAYPNPTTSGTSIDFSLSGSAVVRAAVFDVGGRHVAAIKAVSGRTGTLGWDGKDSFGKRVTAGLYFVRIETRGSTMTRKVLVLR